MGWDGNKLHYLFNGTEIYSSGDLKLYYQDHLCYAKRGGTGFRTFVDRQIILKSKIGDIPISSYNIKMLGMNDSYAGHTIKTGWGVEVDGVMVIAGTIYDDGSNGDYIIQQGEL